MNWWSSRLSSYGFGRCHLCRVPTALVPQNATWPLHSILVTRWRPRLAQKRHRSRSIHWPNMILQVHGIELAIKLLGTIVQLSPHSVFIVHLLELCTGYCFITSSSGPQTIESASINLHRSSKSQRASSTLQITPEKEFKGIWLCSLLRGMQLLSYSSSDDYVLPFVHLPKATPEDAPLTTPSLHLPSIVGHLFSHIQ